MSAVVIIGGQYGSEGKGKVAHYYAKKYKAKAVVRCGGPNSGHSIIYKGKKVIFQHLPTAAILSEVTSFLAAGSYINLDILLKEIDMLDLKNDSLFIDENAVILNGADREETTLAHLYDISSTLSGTGYGVLSRVNRNPKRVLFAKDVPELQKYICNVSQKLNDIMDKGNIVIVEGTQGYGLSVLHSPHYPYVTSRDTTAAGFISECGISPLRVSEVILTIRAFPIRVAGNSGPLENETTWEEIAQAGNYTNKDIREYTSVTNKLRRVAYFDPEIVKEAIRINGPTQIVLNHLDLLQEQNESLITAQFKEFISKIERQIDYKINYLGLGPDVIMKNNFTLFFKKE